MKMCADLEDSLLGNPVYFSKESLTWHAQDLFDPTKEFSILRGVSAHVLDTTWHFHPRVRSSICLQDRSVCMMVRLYLHRQLACS